MFRNLWALTSARKAFRCSTLLIQTQKPKLMLELRNMDSKPTPEALEYPKLQAGYFSWVVRSPSLFSPVSLIDIDDIENAVAVATTMEA